MRSERESRWRGAVTLSVCIGAAVYLMTGERGKAFLVALLYWLAGAVLVGPFLLMKVGYYGRSGRPPAWVDLQATYAAKGPEPGGLETGRELVVKRMTGQLMFQPYTHKRAFTHFGDAGAYFALAFPLSWVYDPVFVPINHVRECRRDRFNSGYTTLALAGVAVEIDVADDEGRVRAWCEHHEIPDGSE